MSKAGNSKITDQVILTMAKEHLKDKMSCPIINSVSSAVLYYMLAGHMAAEDNRNKGSLPTARINYAFLPPGDPEIGLKKLTDKHRSNFRVTLHRRLVTMQKKLTGGRQMAEFASKFISVQWLPDETGKFEKTYIGITWEFQLKAEKNAILQKLSGLTLLPEDN